jgi:hypothetical protein
VDHSPFLSLPQQRPASFCPVQNQYTMKRLSFLTTMFLILGIAQFAHAQQQLAKNMLNEEMVKDPIFQEMSKLGMEIYAKVMNKEIDLVGIIEYQLSMPEGTPDKELENGILKQKGGQLFMDISRNIKELGEKLTAKYPQFNELSSKKAPPSHEELRVQLEQMKAMFQH